MWHTKEHKKMIITSLFLVLMLVSFIVFEDSITGFVTVIAQGGYITEMNLEFKNSADNWYGIYGNLSSLGVENNTFTSFNISNIDIYYNNTLNENVYIFASNESEFSVSFIKQITPGQVDALLGWDINDKLSATNTFKDLIYIPTAKVNLQVYSTSTNSNNGTYIIAPVLANDKLVFLTITDNGNCFNGDECNYQMILPQFLENTTYYFKVYKQSEVHTDYQVPSTDSTPRPRERGALIGSAIEVVQKPNKPLNPDDYDGEVSAEDIGNYTGISKEKFNRVIQEKNKIDFAYNFRTSFIKLISSPITLSFLIIIYLFFFTAGLRRKNENYVEQLELQKSKLVKIKAHHLKKIKSKKSKK